MISPLAVHIIVTVSICLPVILLNIDYVLYRGPWE